MLLSCPTLMPREMEARTGFGNLFANELQRMVLSWLSCSSEKPLVWLIDDVDGNDVGSPDVFRVSLLPAFSNTEQNWRLTAVRCFYLHPQTLDLFWRFHLLAYQSLKWAICQSIQESNSVSWCISKVSHSHTKNWRNVPSKYSSIPTLCQASISRLFEVNSAHNEMHKSSIFTSWYLTNAQMPVGMCCEDTAHHSEKCLISVPWRSLPYVHSNCPSDFSL